MNEVDRRFDDLPELDDWSGEKQTSTHVEPAAELRAHQTRDLALRRLVEELSPAGVEPGIWKRWLLDGGENPFEPSKLKRGHSTQNSGREMSRSTVRIKAAMEKVERARENLESAEAYLERMRALDDALVQQAVSDHLASIVAPIFAMGPAWVLMRVVSAFVSQAELEVECELTSDPARRQKIEAAVREERRVASLKALQTLDLWAGQVDFERELREAIMAIIDQYAAKGDVAENRRLNRRGLAHIVKSAQPNATLTAREVLEGLRDGS